MIRQLSTQAYQGQGLKITGSAYYLQGLLIQTSGKTYCDSLRVADLVWTFGPTALDLGSVTLCLPPRVTNQRVGLGRQPRVVDLQWQTYGQTYGGEPRGRPMVLNLDWQTQGGRPTG